MSNQYVAPRYLRPRKPRKVKPGPRFSRVGFYVEGIYFPATDLGLECASAYGAKLVREYGRPVSVLACMMPGAAQLAFERVPEDSIEAETRIARSDAHGYVITGQGQTTMGVR